MSKRNYFRQLVPPWDMPADPVKAVGWFMHWLLKVVVHFFWVPILGMVIYEFVSNWRVSGVWNGIVSGVITLFVGLVVWAVLYVILVLANISANVSRVVSQFSEFQQKFSPYSPNQSSYSDSTNPKVVEGTISEIKEQPQKKNGHHTNHK